MKMIRRTGWFYLAVVTAMIGMIFRIFWLSIGENAVQTERVINRRQEKLVLYHTKGIIYDEDLEPIAGNQPCWYLVIDPRSFQRENMQTLLELTNTEENKLNQKLKKETPFVLETKKEPTMMPGVRVFEGVTRYSGVSPHLLGYLDSAGEAGLSGVEKEYGAFLDLFSSSVTVSYTKDAVRGAIAGLGMELEESEPTENGLVLTLDGQLCRALERSMDQYIKKGAGVILDCKTGEIKAIASRPGYEEEAISSYLQSTEGELVNRAFAAQTVGSVFKIVMAACALEGNMEEFQYDCEGGIVVGGRTFSCQDQKGHGTIGLQEALAQSCNSYFIALGQLLGYDKIAEMAKRFGYGESIEILGSICASKGNLSSKSSNLSLANLSIGQGELTATPMQIARMTAVVANGGTMPEIQLYRGLFLNGKIKGEAEKSKGSPVISSDIAEKLRQYCVYAVEQGTGQSAKPENGTAGGKTSSAQTGVVEDGVEKLNVYFSGFYPAEEPQYVITVFAENGVSGGKTCAPVFREVCEFLGSATHREK